MRIIRRILRKTGVQKLRWHEVGGEPQGLRHEEVWTEDFVEVLWRNVTDDYKRNYVLPLNTKVNSYLNDCTTVLDVGCGWMPYKPDARYTGFDVSAAMIERAKRLHPDTMFLQGSAYNLPFNDNAFDGVRSSGMLRHMKDWRTPLREMLRVAKRKLTFTHMVGGTECRCGRYQWCTPIGEILRELPTPPIVKVVKSWNGHESVLFMVEL